MLTMADKGGRGGRQMLTIDDKGGGGGRPGVEKHIFITEARF